MVQDKNESIIKYFLSKYPEEAVLFLKDGELIAVENIHREPETCFLVSPLDYIKIDPDAIIHSHPNGSARPSEADITLRKITDIPLGIFAIDDVGVKEVVWI